MNATNQKLEVNKMPNKSTALEYLAEQYARKYHDGQYRKKDNRSYIVHPESVVKYLKLFGYADEKTICIGWLHDTLEDTSLQYETIDRIFGRDVADGVYVLTRNIDSHAYKERLGNANKNVQMVKLCDTLDIIQTLECLSLKGIKRKIVDCMAFYIPLAKEICPSMVPHFEEYILEN